MTARLLIPALLLVGAPAGATVVAPLDLAGLTDHAETIVVGRVEAQSARWTSDKSAIYTAVSERVAQPLKGGARAGDLVTLRREGGEVGGMGMLVSGAARFSVGEEVVVFLERRGAALWTVGMAQGKLHVAVVDGRKVAFRDVAGLGFVTRPPPEPASRPLDELVSAVRARVRATVKEGGAK